ncbi:cytochrome P450 oxidoreductase [Corynespora cassiicola Philippines]|uniref:Cytochrome P450 oxidoreductase n=1 Tax=Corynespora cassiicola Philippines TaxID=1448308 RepID=A0A2T2N7L5_CORCC|nr:cytochrome P450 oxidoreductase [Corynespora cassiicola Philippines]
MGIKDLLLDLDPNSTFKLLGASLALYLISIAIYNRYFHPLKDIPGPFLASITSFWYYWSIVTSRWENYQLPIHHKYGPIVRLAPNHIQVSAADEIETIYGPKNNFHKSQFYGPFDSGISPRPDNFALIDDKVHSARRRMVAHIYTQAAVLQYEPCVDRVISLFEGQIGQVSKSGEVFDMSLWLRRYTFDVVGEIFYGREGGFGFLREGIDYNNWISLFDVLMKPIAANHYIPRGLKNLALAGQFLLSSEIRAGMLGYPTTVQQAHEALKQRMEDMASNRPVNRNDVLSKLIDVANSEDKKSEFNMLDVTAEILSIIFAGADTTATSLISIFYFIHKNPPVLKRLLEEIDAAFSDGRLKHPVRFNDAFKLPYLRAVVNESMRIHPSMGLSLPRIVPPDGAQICGKYIPGGFEVAMNPPVVHFDPKVFGEDADKFVPERWIRDGERVGANMERHILQFGYGKRICIGKHIAHTEMYKLLPTILHKYTFELQVEEWSTKREFFQQQKNVLVKVTGLRT